MPKSPTRPTKSLSCYSSRKEVARILVTACLLLRSSRVPSCPNLLESSQLSPHKAPMRLIRGSPGPRPCPHSLPAPRELMWKGFPQRTLPPRPPRGLAAPEHPLRPAAVATASAAGCTMRPCRPSLRARQKILMGAHMTTDPPRAQHRWPGPGWLSKAKTLSRMRM